MGCRRAPEVHFVSLGSIEKRLKGTVSMDSKTDANTALTRQEEKALVGAVPWARHHDLALKNKACRHSAHASSL